MIQEKKTIGKFTSLWGACLLCLCMAFCLLADLPVEAATSEDWDWEYEMFGDEMVEITNYNGEETEIVIPETIDGKSVISIGYQAFKDCSSLTSITIPSSVTNIGAFAFENCSSLTSINIPNSMIGIGAQAFEGCSSITSIDIPSSVMSVGDFAFFYCTSLTSINVAEDSTNYASKNGILYDKSCETLICCPAGKQGTIKIPKSVTNIGGNAFYKCSNITSIEIPSSVTNIGTWAFESCSSLTSIEIPSSVTSIGNFVFYECSSLTSITIPSSVTSIGNEVFRGCSSLTSITIPSSVTSIGNEAFRDCSNLTSIEIPSSVTEIGPSTFEGCSSDLTIYGESGSYAEEYAEEKEIKFSTGKMPSPHTHRVVTDPDKAPTCTEAGKKTVESHCALCGEVIQVQEVIAATGHRYQPILKAATAKKNGTIIRKCSACGDIEQAKSITIYAASGIKLSKTSFTYNGKNQKPTVILKDSKGTQLPAGSYKITYPKTSKNVGEYTVIVTLQGNYSGTVKLTYQITPKGTSLSKLTAKKKGFTAKWKKQTSQTTGYELQYSTSSKFKGAKTITVKKNKTVSQSIAKLKAGKKYYVRIRTYKTIKVNGKNVKLCSGWSKVKSVKVKR